MFNDKSKKFLQQYLDNTSPTGFESPGQKIWLDYIKPYTDSYFTDNYGTAVAVINEEAPYKVVIEAHADEISWFVKYISNEGYIYVTQNGGSDPAIAPSQRVNIHTRNGIVKGVFGWPAIHVRDKENDIKPDVKNIFIDCGCTTKHEVEALGVHVGCVVTFSEGMDIINEKFLIGRALDNRIGGFMIAEVARKLHENKKKLPFGLYIVNAVQEEVGLRGAEMIARRIKPDLAIVTDVTHDTTAPMYDKKVSGDQHIGKGPVLTYGPAVHNNVLQMIIDTATQHDIYFQRGAATRQTGTDTDAFAYSNEGVPSALISLALKYMHTTVEMVHIGDVERIVTLIYEFLLQLEDGHDFRYIK